MSVSQLFFLNSDLLEIRSRRPLWFPALFAALFVGSGLVFFTFQWFASEGGFFTRLDVKHEWLLWLFGSFFVLMGLLIFYGAIKTIRNSPFCTLDLRNQLLKIEPWIFGENAQLVIPLESVNDVEVLTSVTGWIDQIKHLKNSSQLSPSPNRPTLPFLFQFAHLKMEELRLRASPDGPQAKAMIPEEDRVPDRETPKFLIRFVLKSGEPLLLYWMESFNQAEIENTAARIRNFLGLNQA